MKSFASTSAATDWRSLFRAHAREVSNAAMGVAAVLFWLVSSSDDA